MALANGLVGMDAALTSGGSVMESTNAATTLTRSPVVRFIYDDIKM